MPKADQAGWSDIDVRAVDTARLLAADAVQKVGNGHPGTAMSLAPVAYLIYQNLMTYDPTDTEWIGRDRFVLSCGHSSLTQYVQLYLSGSGLELDDLKALRTWGSKTPGHPEVHHTKGVDITTGPLGSGLASAVGMAMAQRRQKGLYDPKTPAGESPFDHHVYVIASDGDIMEGVTAEASSLAGHQQLGNLTLVYDENYISIEDDTNVSFSEDVAKRYESYGWDVRVVDWRASAKDGGKYTEDVDALFEAIEEGKKVTDKPSIVILRTIIAYPAPTKQNTGKAHGSALGEDEIKATKELLGFDPEQTFEVDDAVIAHTRKAIQRGQAAHAEWTKKFDAWKSANPEAAKLLERVQAKKLPVNFDEALPVFEADAKGIASRAASGKVLNALADVVPELWGGSADLAGSNNTTMDNQPSFIPAERSTSTWKGNPYGRTLHFGIRENAMGMILNGIELEGLTRAYGGTFLVFSDYMRPAVRLAAIQQIPSTFVWTHDSIGVGEDGPTHQPIEHLSALRAIPNLNVVRPGDANETAQAWKKILETTDAPTGLILSRQELPTLDRSEFASAEGTTKGGYVLADSEGEPNVILVATGSELSLAVEARKELEAKGVATRVVSMPCREWFDAQDDSYKESVLPKNIKARVAVEAGHPMSWYDIVGTDGRVVGIDHFGASADAKTLFTEFGFTPEKVVEAAEASIAAVEGK
nr:transketolase [Dermacoccus nishinomiyaensis]